MDYDVIKNHEKRIQYQVKESVVFVPCIWSIEDR